MQGISDFFRVILTNRRSCIGLIMTIFFIFLMATIGPSIFKLDTQVDYQNRYQKPSFEHWLGTDYGGRDVWWW